MDVDMDMYPESARDQLQDAIKTSVERYIRKEIREKNIECKNCDSEKLESRVEKDEDGNLEEKAVCLSCETEIDVEVKSTDLRSGF